MISQNSSVDCQTTHDMGIDSMVPSDMLYASDTNFLINPMTNHLNNSNVTPMHLQMH